MRRASESVEVPIGPTAQNRQGPGAAEFCADVDIKLRSAPRQLAIVDGFV
jgi:hypothetical protein